MKERPILFSGPMVKAIMEWKWQTRRVMNPQPVGGMVRFADGWADDRWYERDGAKPDGPRIIKCPYGQPGDRLWVRETWAYNGQASRNYGPKDQRREGYVTYAADGARVTHTFPEGPMLPAPPQTPPTRIDGEDELDFAARTDDYYKNYFRRMRAPRHMFRWASRLTLEVTEVRVQRLQEISEEDARAEGVKAAPFCKAGRPGAMGHVEAFEDLWDSINGERPGCSWGSNPWVWAISFRRAP